LFRKIFNIIKVCKSIRNTIDGNCVLHKHQPEKSFVFDSHGRKVAFTLPPIYKGSYYVAQHNFVVVLSFKTRNYNHKIRESNGIWVWL